MLLIRLEKVVLVVYKVLHKKTNFPSHYAFKLFILVISLKFFALRMNVIFSNVGPIIGWHNNCSEAAFFQTKTRKSWVCEWNRHDFCSTTSASCKAVWLLYQRKSVIASIWVHGKQQPCLARALFGESHPHMKMCFTWVQAMSNISLIWWFIGPKDSQLKLDWPTRHKICVGIARGLAYLHEESRLKIVHRDIKATNVLLDKDLNPKISDFGLAKLDEEENTHISTRIAGTLWVTML